MSEIFGVREVFAEMFGAYNASVWPMQVITYALGIAAVILAVKKTSYSDKIISGMKWRGGMELEIVKSFENELYVIEINPRIPAWVYLAVGAGQNLPEAMVKLALGMEVRPYTRYEVGKMFIRYSYDLITDVGEFERLSTFGEL